MNYTVKDVIDKLKEPVAPIYHTVDTLKSGNLEQTVTGIATVFTATCHAIKQAAAAGANLIITHEPTFYQHEDKTEWLQNDSVVKAKQALIEETGIAIFRFHDYWHSYKPDGITTGMLQALDWETLVNKEEPNMEHILQFPPMTVNQIAEHVKAKLGISNLRLVGDPTMVCQKVALAPGFGGCGPMSIPLFSEHHVDLVIAGESPEWETPEYVRDAVELGEQKALLIIGHLKSEEAGMASLTERLRVWFPGLNITFIEEKPVFNHLL
ncbi:MAG: Nif3-like dinuclear metal center hexameric protein [Gorillibacterium sp.]|nr:Nif3-like dinuclear metal center hexameric protein [Gorillibacterium sp.]